jgi:hypothetical protein
MGQPVYNRIKRIDPLDLRFDPSTHLKETHTENLLTLTSFHILTLQRCRPTPTSVHHPPAETNHPFCRNKTGKRKWPRLVVLSNASQRVKLDLFNVHLLDVAGFLFYFKIDKS